MRPKGQKVERKNLAIPITTIEKIRELQKKWNAASLTEVIRRSIDIVHSQELQEKI